MNWEGLRQFIPRMDPTGRDWRIRPSRRHTGQCHAPVLNLRFPFSLPPLKEDDKGKFNRPYYINYYFKHLDMEDGPADPTCFCDHLVMVFQDPPTKREWECPYLVATPSGLRELMQTENFESVYLDERTILVRQWDLSLILRTIIDEHLKDYGSQDDEPTQPEPPKVM